MNYSSHTISPQGNGSPPPNYVAIVKHMNDEFVVWHKDQNGWAVGYEIHQYPTRWS